MPLARRGVGKIARHGSPGDSRQPGRFWHYRNKVSEKAGERDTNNNKP